MIAIEKIEGKDQNLLLKNINIDDVHYKFNEIPGKLFKSKRTELIILNTIKRLSDEGTSFIPVIKPIPIAIIKMKI